MKKKIIIGVISCVCIAALAALAVYFGRSGKEVEESLNVYRFDSDYSTEIQVIKNGDQKLEFDPNTAQFTYTDAKGNVWYSNPQGTDLTREELKAMLVIEYKDYKGVKYPLDSYDSSVARGNWCYEVVDEQTLRIDYTIGKIEKTYFIPLAVPYARYEEIQAMLSDEAIKEMKSAYRIYDIDNLFAHDNKDELLEMYPDLAETKVAVLRPDTQEWKKEKIEGYMIEAGYTEDMYKSDLEYYGVEVTSKNPAVNVSVILKLEDNGLVVSVPFEKLEYYTDYPLTEIRVLPYMCSAGLDREGYLFVPDGSGAMINFNNQKTNQSMYSAKIYGWDYGQVRTELVNDPSAQFPVYGIGYEDTNQSMLCIVEEGESYGYIEADVSGKRHNYNYVTAAFTVVHNEEADVSGGKSNTGVYLFEENLDKTQSITLRYMTMDDSDYVTLAKTYRSYLLEKYPVLAEGVSGEMPVAVELIGAITKRQHVLGFPKDLPYALSTYAEMQAIVEDLNAAGMTKLDVILSGWFNDGVKHDVADEINLISKLGNKKSFKNLISAVSEDNTLFAKADFTFVYNNSLFDSFTVRGDAGKYLNREPIEMQEISNIWYGTLEDSDYTYVAKPSVMMSNLTSFRKDLSKYDLKNIAFASMGNILAADYNRRATVNRATVVKQQVEKFAQIVSDGGKNLVYVGNEYAIPYADVIIKAPLTSDNPNIVDEVIPFFSIVLHGYVDYTGDALNITGDFVTNILKSAECGAGLYYVFMDADTDELQNTSYTEYFGASYEAWKEDAVKWQQRFKTDFGSLYGQTIENHEIVETNVALTEYADGTKVYVNYRTADFTTEDGVVVPAQDWIVVKGGNE